MPESRPCEKVSIGWPANGWCANAGAVVTSSANAPKRVFFILFPFIYLVIEGGISLEGSRFISNLPRNTPSVLGSTSLSQSLQAGLLAHGSKRFISFPAFASGFDNSLTAYSRGGGCRLRPLFGSSPSAFPFDPLMPPAPFGEPYMPLCEAKHPKTSSNFRHHKEFLRLNSVASLKNTTLLSLSAFIYCLIALKIGAI